MIQITLNLVLTIWFIKGVLDYASLLIVGIPWLKVLVDIPRVILAIYLAVWVSLVPLEYVFRWLQKIPAVRRYFTRSFTKSFRRYSAPGFKPWKD